MYYCPPAQMEKLGLTACNLAKTAQPGNSKARIEIKLSDSNIYAVNSLPYKLLCYGQHFFLWKYLFTDHSLF